MSQPYQEECSTFSDNGTVYDLNTIWKAVNNRPVEYISVDTLAWVIQPTDIVDEERVNHVDLSAPLLVTKRDNQELALTIPPYRQGHS